MLNNFESSGILVHASFTPDPAKYGQRQTSTVGVPWPNQVFFYAMVAVDDEGNRSPISNVLSVYIPETPTTTTTTTEASLLSFGSSGLFENLYRGAVDGNLDESAKRSEELKMFIGVGVVAGLVLLMILIVSIIIVRTKSRVRKEYDAENRDTYKAYEPAGKPDVVPAKTNPDSSANASQLQAKNLSHWLDSLPRSDSNGHSPNTTAHDLSMEQGGTLRKHHTLTKTNPYRHKVLTNGSFLNLNTAATSPSAVANVVTPGGANSVMSSEDGSSRPTTSTEDTSGTGSSQSSESGDFSSGPLRTVAVKRSHTLSGNGNVIDTSTARAIIDTYSGNLFGSGRQQHLRARQQAAMQASQYDQSVVVEQDSLESANYQSRDLPHVIPAPALFSEASSSQGTLTSRHSMRLRTESVV